MTFLPHRRIDNQINFAVGDQIQHIGPSLFQFMHHFRFNAGFLNQTAGVFGSDNLKACFRKFLCHFHNLRLIPVADGNQYRAL